MKRILLLTIVLLTGARADWTGRKLIGSYPNWDYWWLNVRLAIDPSENPSTG